MGRASRQPQLSKMEQLQRQRAFDYSKSLNSSGENNAWKLKSKQQLKEIGTLLDIAEEKGILIVANKPGLLHKTDGWRLDYQKTTTVSSKATPAHYVLAIQDNQSAKVRTRQRLHKERSPMVWTVQEIHQPHHSVLACALLQLSGSGDYERNCGHSPRLSPRTNLSCSGVRQHASALVDQHQDLITA